MSETRKLAADVVRFGRLAGTDEERAPGRLRGLRSDPVEPAVAIHHGRIVEGSDDGSLALAA